VKPRIPAIKTWAHDPAVAHPGGRRIFATGGLLAAVVLIAACAGHRESPLPIPSVSAASPAHAAAPWTHLAAAEPFYGGAFEGPFDEVTAGVAYGDGFVLVGRSIDADDVWRGVIWTSRDGTDWTRVVDGGAAFDRMYIPKVATDGHRLVALGWAVPWDEQRGPYVAWVSDDGVTWHRNDQVDSTDLGRINADGSIVGSGSGFLAWGSQADGHVALMRSMDGLAWKQVTVPDAGTADIRSVAPFGAGYLAVGAEHPEQPGFVGGPSQAARAWWSPDGQQWLSAKVDHGWSLGGVYPGASGVAAFGAPECSRCVGPRLAWHSIDGRSWTSPGVESQTYPFVASNGSQIAVFDWQGDRSIALSGDGLNWHRATEQLPAAEYDAGVIVGRTGVLLLVAKTPVVGGAQVVHSGVLFLRGS
jgi:hypothetical protein